MFSVAYANGDNIQQMMRTVVIRFQVASSKFTMGISVNSQVTIAQCTT